jgi:phosphatidylinositol glycan class M
LCTVDYTVYRAAALNVYRALAAVFTGTETETLLPTSPYAVPTYRYSPLLALVLTPIAALDVYGKLLFSAADAATGVVLASLLREMKLPAQYCSTVAFLWAVNPFSTIIATRGSSDAISNLLFLCVLLLLMRRRLVLAGVVYGFLVHFRLFHIVYSAALALSVLRGGPRAPALRALRWLSYKPDLKLVSKFVKALDLRGCFTFTLAAVATFATLFAACFAVYGQDYLNNSILFHFTRFVLCYQCAGRY